MHKSNSIHNIMASSFLSTLDIHFLRFESNELKWKRLPSLNIARFRAAATYFHGVKKEMQDVSIFFI